MQNIHPSFTLKPHLTNQGFKMRARICIDKGMARSIHADPMQPIIETAAHASSSVDTEHPPPLVHDQYFKGKRPLEGGGRGQILKATKVEASSDRSKGKGKPSPTSFFPRFREYFYLIVNPG
jgi:hypothetical protein